MKSESLETLGAPLDIPENKMYLIPMFPKLPYDRVEIFPIPEKDNVALTYLKCGKTIKTLEVDQILVMFAPLGKYNALRELFEEDERNKRVGNSG